MQIDELKGIHVARWRRAVEFLAQKARRKKQLAAVRPQDRVTEAAPWTEWVRRLRRWSGPDSGLTEGTLLRTERERSSGRVI